MDTKNVLTFVIVAKELSFAKAAQVLHLSQPSVTARIQALEAELGKPLFYRGHRSIRLTREGEVFLPFAWQLLEAKEEAEAKLKGLNNTFEGVVTLGATALWSVYVLPKILAEILSNYSSVEFHVITGNSMQIVDKVMDNEVHVGLVSSKVDKHQIRQVELGEFELILVCGPKHPFAGQKSIEMNDFLRTAMVTYQQSSDAWKYLTQIFKRHGAVPNVVMQLNQIEAAKEMVSASTCVCMIPEISVRKELEEGRLIKLDVKGLPGISQQMSFIYQRKKEHYPLIEMMQHALIKHFKDTNFNNYGG